MGCTSCGNSKAAVSPVYDMARQTLPRRGVLDDRDLIMARFISPRRGSRMIWGVAGFEERIEGLHMQRTRPDNQYRICYGHRGPGDEFLVHVRDLEMAPHLFQSVEVRGMVEQAQPEAPPEPELIAEPEPMPEPVPIVPVAAEGDDKGNGRPTLAQAAMLDLEALPGISPGIAKQLRADGITTRDGLLELGIEGLQEYKGVGEVKAGLILGAVGALDA